MKTINFELSKKLNDLGLLDNIETEFRYFIGEWVKKLDDLNNSVIDNIGITRNWKDYKRGGNDFVYKTLTLEEAIEFLNNNKITFLIENSPYYSGNEKISISVEYIKGKLLDFGSEKGKTLLEAIEKMLEYLLKNNLLTK